MCGLPLFHLAGLNMIAQSRITLLLQLTDSAAAAAALVSGLSLKLKGASHPNSKVGIAIFQSKGLFKAYPRIFIKIRSIETRNRLL